VRSLLRHGYTMNHSGRLENNQGNFPSQGHQQLERGRSGRLLAPRLRQGHIQLLAVMV
jgi:hypothetical protein